jgi:hypothetical protein
VESEEEGSANPRKSSWSQRLRTRSGSSQHSNATVSKGSFRREGEWERFDGEGDRLTFDSAGRHGESTPPFFRAGLISRIGLRRSWSIAQDTPWSSQLCCWSGRPVHRWTDPERKGARRRGSCGCCSKRLRRCNRVSSSLTKSTLNSIIYSHAK